MPYAPQPQSKRSKRRVNRGFKSLEVSCRKHRRAHARLAAACSFGGKLHEPGHKESPTSGDFVFTAGGSIRYHC